MAAKKEVRGRRAQRRGKEALSSIVCARVTGEFLKKIDGWATLRDITRSAAILDLLKIGWESERRDFENALNRVMADEQ